MQNKSGGFLSSRLSFPVKRKQMFPQCSDRAAWSCVASNPLLRDMVSAIRKQAVKINKSPIPELRASEFALYLQNGNRSIYQKPYFAIRYNLETLVLAECLDGKGAYINRIVDYIWAICSEPCWTIPAHVRDKGDVLPSYRYSRNDLFATQTGLLLAFTLDLMETELAAFSATLVDRVRKDIIDRLIVRLESDESDHWYSGINNWSSWCSCNLMGAALTALEDDQERLEKVIRKLAGINDLFYQRYSDDGACDEGPGYWAHSPVELCRFIEQAISAGVLSVDIYEDKKLRAMIGYIAEVNLGKDVFFSYSDSSNKVNDIPCGLLTLLARRLNDENIAYFAKQVFHYFKSEKVLWKYGHMWHSALLGNLLELFYVPGADWKSLSDSTKFYRSRGYLAGRCGKTGFGFKGGSNNECHNHNDVGHFVIAHDGKFLVCDLGSPTYDRSYFSAERYDNIVCNARGHNMPLFDGVGEVHGEGKEPQCIGFKDENGIVSCSIEAQGPYSDELELESVKRDFSFDRNTGRFQITDSWSCGRKYRVSCTFLSEIKAEKISDTEVKLGKFKLSVDSGVLSLEEFEMTDPKLRERWGKLWKIQLDHSKPQKSGNHTITIDMAK